MCVCECVCVWERERERERETKESVTDWRKTTILTLSYLRSESILMALQICIFDRMLSTGVRRGPHGPPTFQGMRCTLSKTLECPNLFFLTDWLTMTDRSVCEHPSIYNFITPTHSFRFERMIGFIPFPRVLVLCEMQSVSSRIWTRVAVFISYNDNHYTSRVYYSTT